MEGKSGNDIEFDKLLQTTREGSPVPTLIEEFASRRGPQRQEITSAFARAVETTECLPEELIDDLIARLDDPPPEREAAASVLASIAATRPDALVDSTELLAGYLSEPIVSPAIERALSCVGDEDPEALGQIIPQLRGLLQTDSALDTDRALHLLRILTKEQPELVEPAVPELLDLTLRGESSSAESRRDVRSRQHSRKQQIKDSQRRLQIAADILFVLSADGGENLVGRTPDLVEALPEMSEPLQRAVLRIIANLYAQHTDELQAILRPLCKMLATPKSKGVAVQLARVIAQSHDEDGPIIASELAPHIDVLVDLLDSKKAEGRASAAVILTHIADHEPESLRNKHSALRAALNDPDDSVRASIVWTLGALGDSPGELRKVAENDESELVRRIAKQFAEESV